MAANSFTAASASGRLKVSISIPNPPLTPICFGISPQQLVQQSLSSRESQLVTHILGQNLLTATECKSFGFG